MSLTLRLFPPIPAPSTAVSARRDAILRAFDLVDDGSTTFEIGRPATGATCVLVSADGAAGRDGFHLVIPLMRTPTSARDLIPACAAAVPMAPLDGGDRGDAPWRDSELVALWDERHAAACRELMAMCEAQGSPPPPHLPLRHLEQLHALLLARNGKAILGVDFQDGGAVTLAVPAGDDAPLHVVPGRVVEVDGVAVLRVAGHEDRSLARARLVTPVEIVDVESLMGT